MRDRNDSLALTTAIGGLVALAIAMGIGRFAFTPILPMMQADGVLSLREGGWLASANYLGYLVGALLAGRRGGGPRALLRNGLVLVVVTTASMGALASLPWWLVARFVAGVASAWVLVGTAALSLARLNEIGRPRLSGLVFAGVGAGTALAGLACQLIASLGGGATAAWWALAIVAGAGIAFVWRGVGAAAAVDDVVAAVGTPAASDPGAACKAGDAAVSAPGGSAGRPAETPAGPAARRDQHRLVLCYGLFGFGYILPATFLPAQARALVADPAVFGWVWPVFGLAALVSTVVAARLASTWPRRGLWACAQLVMAGGVLLPALWPQLVALVVAALCVGGTFVVITMIGLQEARVVAGARAQALMAAMTAAFAAGQLAGPLLVGVMDSFAVPYEIALWLAAGGLAASAALLGRHSSRTFRSQQELT